MSAASTCTVPLNRGLGLPSHTSSPHRRTTSRTDPRTPPCSPRNTEQIWDEYERCAKERSRSREASLSSFHLRGLESQQLSSGTALDGIKSNDPYSSPKAPTLSPASSVAPSSRLGFGTPPSFSQRRGAFQGTSLGRTSCENCKQLVTLPSTTCEECKQKGTTTSTPRTEESLPRGPEYRSVASADMAILQKHITSSTTGGSQSSGLLSSSTSPKRATGTQKRTVPIRLSSFDYSQPPNRISDLLMLRHDLPVSKVSTPAHRIPRKPVPQPSTPIGCSFSLLSPTFNSSNVAPPALITPPSASSRHHPATLLASSPEYHLSLYPPTPTTIGTNRTSANTPLHRVSCSMQNTVSVWEDDDDDEKVGLVDYLRRGWRGSRSSFAFTGRRESDSATGMAGSVIVEREVGRNSTTRTRWRRWIRCGCFGCKDD